MCALQDHVQRCLQGDKTGQNGGVISPRNITGKLRGEAHREREKGEKEEGERERERRNGDRARLQAIADAVCTHPHHDHLFQLYHLI
jgi:hypothetical protein